ncbi:unnamed protein product [Anisakis simplex]|uniref:Pre-mRNA-splicing factor SYF2 n=1 Tax=Anisakis simplex TaxID=6269 RepID=A0A0M3JV92_ANISI|nr:unnamed protein product [Anisakis simplex]
MKGNKELADKLRRKLAGLNEDESNQSSSHNDSDNEKVQLLLKTDKRSGLTMPLSSAGPSGLPKHQQKPSKTSDGKYNLGSVDAEYRSQMSIHEMANEERITSAREQLSMFNRATKATVERKTDDDWVVDDAIMSHKRKMKYDERDERKKRNKAIQDIILTEKYVMCFDIPVKQAL